MFRRTSTLGVLALVSVVLCLSLGAALARSASSALLTPTALPIFDQAAYLPLLLKHDAPPASSTATVVSTVIPTVTRTTDPTPTGFPTATSTTAPTTTATSTTAPTTTATSTTAPTTTATSTTTSTAEPTNTGTTEPTNTATSTTEPTNTATSTAEPTTTATNTASSTVEPTNTATSTAEPTTTATSTAEPTTTATSTTEPTSTATIPPTATATATVPPVYNACINNTFPIAVSKLALEKNLPYWYKPISMEARGLSPFADDPSIPSLNSTNPASPRFRVYATTNNYSSGPTYYWARWNGADSSGSSLDLSTALSGVGNLAAGFSEFAPPASDPAALPLVNGRLEAGDWLAGTGATASTTATYEALNHHIAQKTMLVLPVYDMVVGPGASAGSGYRVERFIQVRLLNYQLVPNGNAYLEFALVNGNHLCALELTVGDQLEWYAPAAVEASYDIVIVHDYSYSMRFCWNTNQSCPVGSRRIDPSAASLRSFVDEMLVQRNLAQGGDNRLAYVTYGQNKTQRIPFINDTNAALAAFNSQIGTLSSPRTIPDSDLDGNTNTASGLVGAAAYLNGARTVDRNGKPVRLVVLLLTDGIANVFNDGGYAGVSNRYNVAPFRCGDYSTDMDNPYVQSTCPSDAEFPNINPKPLPPLKAMVKAADDARAARPVTFHAIVLGNQFGLTPVDMHLDKVAPDHYAMASSPAELATLVAAVASGLDETETICQKFTSWLPSPGIHVVIRDQDGSVVSEGDSGAGGMYRARLPYNPQNQYGQVSGSYTVDAVHNDVVAPDDPYQIARDYAGGQSVVFVEIGANSYNIGLANTTDPNNPQCP